MESRRFQPNFERKCDHCPRVFRFDMEQEYYCSPKCGHEATLQKLVMRASEAHSSTATLVDNHPLDPDNPAAPELRFGKPMIEAMVEQQGGFSRKHGSIHVETQRTPPDAFKRGTAPPAVYDGRYRGPGAPGPPDDAAYPVIVGHPYAQVHPHTANCQSTAGHPYNVRYAASRNHHLSAPPIRMMDPHATGSTAPQAANYRYTGVPHEGHALHPAQPRTTLPPYYPPDSPFVIGPIRPKSVRDVPEPILRPAQWDARQGSPSPSSSPEPRPRSRPYPRPIISVAAVPIPASRAPVSASTPFVAPALRGARRVRGARLVNVPPNVPVDVEPEESAAQDVYTTVRALRTAEQQAPREFVESAWYSDSDSDCDCE
ncbi:hypothetical protein OBBRIDRAFT_331138 [Obba rivulosa]|uniref:Uncharacterized protein n=1 Tax=Obba rivulosa TaxID=1052685 RepID=A0A8E2AIN4_9APHY|nr:hypothetical protein OBBRIDRAFT_331138 [Obba rivulosa]